MKKGDRVRITNSFFVDDLEYLKKGDTGTIVRRVPICERVCGDFIVEIDSYKNDPGSTGIFNFWRLRKQHLEKIK